MDRHDGEIEVELPGVGGKRGILVRLSLGPPREDGSRGPDRDGGVGDGEVRGRGKRHDPPR